MTDKVIIKAFEQQMKLANESNKVSILGKLMLADVLDLLKHNQAEIERLERETEAKETMIGGTTYIDIKSHFRSIEKFKAEIDRYKGVIKILEKDVENERIDAQKFYNRLKTAEFEPIPTEIKDYAEGYNKAMRDVRMYMIFEYGVKPLPRKQAEQALRKEDEGK